ncbi:MAG: hypothetical protein CVV05_01005 [Gammaproteobacteria bacterium HGW-Gammaproteobacteria-1]|nr:MAG: hypothetical protein CVV05_01005 [Gammaproteobacteria bacterium HGW-Gammaproteobacteria-1]
MNKVRTKKKVLRNVNLTQGTVPMFVSSARVAQARAYAERTHEAFLISLRKAASMDKAAHGVLVGPVKRPSTR